MLIARPDYTPGWTWTGDWEQVCFLKGKKVLLGRQNQRCLSKNIQPKSTLPCGTMVQRQARWSDSFCPAQGRRMVFCSSVRTRYDLGSSSTLSFFLLLTSSFPNLLTLTQTLFCWNRANRKETQGIYGTWFLQPPRTWRTASTRSSF